MEEIIDIPEKVEVSLDKGIMKFKGPKGESERVVFDPRIGIEVKEGKIILLSKKSNKKEKRIIKTLKSHIKNMVRGVSEGHVYKLKICSGHFPMKVIVTGNEFIVENLLGEKIPRKLKLKKGASVKVEGDIVVIESVNKETAGQIAADIEKLTSRTAYDRRIFQDGIYITEKDGKEIK